MLGISLMAEQAALTRLVRVRVSGPLPIKEETKSVIMKTINIEEVKQFVESCSDTTKIYFGADSERFRDKNGKFVADYMLAIVVHIDGKSGCKIFGEVQREFDYDKTKKKPRLRLMTEAYKLADLYLKFGDFFENRDVEIHLDINKDEKHGSSCVLQEAIGFIKGTCNVVPFVKPNATAASYCADRLKYILHEQTVNS